MKQNNFFTSAFNFAQKEGIENSINKNTKNKSLSIIKETQILVPHTLSRFTYKNLPRGRGTTWGNTLRRILLSDMEGYAVSLVKINGVLHMFDSIPGVREVALDVIMNIKQLGIKCTSMEQPEKSYAFEFFLSVEREGDILAKDIICPEDFQIVNPDLFICYSDGSHKVKMNFLVLKGVGYVPIEEISLGSNEEIYNDRDDPCLSLDCNFNPVQNVKLVVEKERVGENIDWEKIIMEVETNGSFSPEECMSYAIGQAVFQISNAGFTEESTNSGNSNLDDESELILPYPKIMYKNLKDCVTLEGRTYRALNSAKINYIGDLIHYSESELLKIANMGDKSIKKIMEELRSHNLTLNMKLENWPPQDFDNIVSILNKNTVLF